jgi:signal transduction histidine kinase/CheY-like chemotaxis protein
MLSIFKKPILWDALLIAGGVGTAALAFAFSLLLSAGVRDELGKVQEEASASRIRSVLQALDQNLQHLTDYTTGYSMWDDTYAYVQNPEKEYLEANYTESILALTPVQLVGIYDLQQKILFSAALSQEGKTIGVPPEIEKESFTNQFRAIRNLRDSVGTLEWLDNRAYLISVCPITDSLGTAPIKGYLLFGRLIDEKMLERIFVLTGVRLTIKPLQADLKPGTLTVTTPILGATAVTIENSDTSEPVQARAVFKGNANSTPAVEFDMQLPVLVSEAGGRLSETVRRHFLIVFSAFTIFLVLVTIGVFRRRMEIRQQAIEGERLRAAKEAADRLAKEAASADHAKSAFLAMMSHEIRTPLNAIIGYAELLRNVPQDAETAEGIQSIRESGAVLMRVLNDILDLSKMEAGKLALQIQPVQTRLLVSEVCGLFRMEAEKQHDQLSAEIDQSVPEWILADDTRLKQVLCNLVSNGVKFTEKGQVRVIARCERQDGVGESGNDLRLEFEVVDDGIGVSTTEEEQLFKPFSQIDSTMSRRYDGTGLGLAICRRLCHLMEGEITFSRREPKGSIFSFHILSTATTGSASQVDEAPPPAATVSEAAEPSVLVVDDNQTNARLMAAILKRLGISPRMALSGQAAIDSYLAEHPDLILMDIQMPGMDGLEATRRIREMERSGNLPRCKIVAVTADILETDRQSALAAGMNAYLSKPVKIGEIQKLVDELRAKVRINESAVPS